jgi:ABC-type sugar transport system permease subunit
MYSTYDDFLADLKWWQAVWLVVVFLFVALPSMILISLALCYGVLVDQIVGWIKNKVGRKHRG